MPNPLEVEARVVQLVSEIFSIPLERITSETDISGFPDPAGHGALALFTSLECAYGLDTRRLSDPLSWADEPELIQDENDNLRTVREYVAWYVKHGKEPKEPIPVTIN